MQIHLDATMRAFSFKDYHYEWLVLMRPRVGGCRGLAVGRIWNFVIDAQRIRNKMAINHDRGQSFQVVSIRV